MIIYYFSTSNHPPPHVRFYTLQGKNVSFLLISQPQAQSQCQQQSRHSRHLYWTKKKRKRINEEDFSTFLLSINMTRVLWILYTWLSVPHGNLSHGQCTGYLIWPCIVISSARKSENECPTFKELAIWLVTSIS